MRTQIKGILVAAAYGLVLAAQVGCLSTHERAALWSHCSYQVLTRGDSPAICPNPDGTPSATATLTYLVGPQLALALAPPEAPSPPGRIESSCDRYQRMRTEPAPAFRSLFFAGAICSRNGPLIARQCLSFCGEVLAASGGI